MTKWISLVLICLTASGFLTVVFLALFTYLKKQILEEIQHNQDHFSKFIKAQTQSERDAVGTTIQGLEQQLKEYRELIRTFEQDRNTKYGQLESQLKNASQSTVKLQETTNRLNDILGNVKLRGQWGERMAEDIIRYAGLQEGVNYLKQKKMSSAAGKPDFTFLLPNQHVVNMDAKFPLDNYLQMVNASVEGEKDRYQKEFIKNVKDRIKEIQSRDYINPLENTLDFVLLFIPNEQVYGFIQEATPDLMDTSLRQKVILCSPFTLYAMLSVIRQAYENFRFEKDMKKIIQHIDIFAKHYEKFKTRFNEIGTFIGNLEKKYDDVRTIDFKKIDTKFKHIEAYKKGHKLEISDHEKVAGLSDKIIDEDGSL